MNLTAVDKIVNATLYEGYVLYPYRASALKNRQRWTFGGIFPRTFATKHNSDPCHIQIQCLLTGTDDTALEVRVRFLHLVMRQAGTLNESVKDNLAHSEELRWSPVQVLHVDGRQYITWEEATEREVVINVPGIRRLSETSLKHDFQFNASHDVEKIHNDAGDLAGIVVRSCKALLGTVTLSIEELMPAVWRITIVINNETSLTNVDDLSRTTAQRYAFASTHTILATQGAQFISLTDPPPDLEQAAAACRNEGAWPVLVGEEGQREQMLASPIILYDYPRIASESQGDLYDGTEIDEILSLRILAMTDEERLEIAAVDQRARALLERTDALTPDNWSALHGTFRTPDITPPWLAVDGDTLTSVSIHGTELRVGDHVRLRPREHNGDIMDLALAGKIAVIEGIESDFEDRVHIAVTLDDDPGRDLGLARMPGHRFFFAPEEIDILESGGTN